MMLRRAFLWAALLSWPAFAQTSPERKDTAGSGLREAWVQARRTFPDALLVSIAGRTDASGAVSCSASSPFEDGWRYGFYSPRKRELLYMAECGGQIVGPLRQISEGGPAPAPRDIVGRFNDSDKALQILRKSGAKFDEEALEEGGRRPFSLKLERLEDDPAHPVVWSIALGDKTFLIDAVRGVKYASKSASQKPKEAVKPAKKKDRYTARKDLAAALAYAKKKYPGAQLMAVEGLVDVWGGLACSGQTGGWAYYFHYPKKGGYRSISACRGRLWESALPFVPVDMNLHRPITGAFVDSDDALLAVPVSRPGEDTRAGRELAKREGEQLLLLNYRTSPFSEQGLGKTTLVWQLKLGPQLFRIDAQKGRVIDTVE